MSTTTIIERSGKIEQFLTFKLALEEYGVPILKVKEIVGLQDITPIPRSPDWILGVINLRGLMLPVVDLKKKCGLHPTEANIRNCIVVADVVSPNKSFSMGILVDEVEEVVSINQDQIEPSPHFSAKLKSDYLLGLGKSGKRIIILLDLDRVLLDSEVVGLGEVAKEVSASQT
jgi:purine-binding chemotaxis protein CheW